MLTNLHLPHGSLPLPAFLPDGTQGVVRALDAQDLLACGVQALQMNAYHLMQRPGSSTVQALGGLHRMAGWPRPIFTDSGGFQIYSLIRQNAKYGSITDRGATFRPDGSRKFNLTPEKSVQLQLSYGSDVVICLDDCTHVEAPYAAQAASVQRTINWAARCKETFTHILEQQEVAAAERPLLMAVIQGGGERDLRRRCAEELLAIGFDAFGYGGWPLDGEGNLLAEMLAFTRDLVPSRFPMHALGVGHPPYVVACTNMGYRLFDSTMPTRDARHGRLYTLAGSPAAGDPATITLDGDDWLDYLYIKDKKHIKTNLPLSPFCDCHTCTHYTVGYLHHLFKLGDHLYPRLATMHNLRFMTRLMRNLRGDHGGHRGGKEEYRGAQSEERGTQSSQK